MFIRNESFYSFRRNYPVITIIVVLHLLLFLWINLFPGGRLIAQTGIGYNLAVANGEYWRIVTPIFMHFGFGHVLFNSFSLVIFGPGLEKMLGKLKFLILYLFAGIVANIATFYIGGLAYPQHLGASGAIFGLFGAYVYIVLNRKDLIDRANSQLVMTILIIGLVMTFINANINILAHLFGLIGGAALVPLLLKGVKPYTMNQYVHEPANITFNPARWTRAKKRRKRLIQALWIILGIFVLFGLTNQFL